MEYPFFQFQKQSCKDEEPTCGRKLRRQPVGQESAVRAPLPETPPAERAMDSASI